MHTRGLPLSPEQLLSLVPALRRATGPAARSPVRPAAPDGYTRIEDQVARTADLVLKVHRLLERAQGLEAQPERAARMARLSAVLEHGQGALRRAVESAETAGDSVPRPREQG